MSVFTCPRCRRTSRHPMDADEGYCGACHEWTEGRPASRICLLCDEAIVDFLNVASIRDYETGPRLAHRECMLREVLGGIGHLEDHAHWCNEMHDPDGGRTFRQSALEVDAWVHEHGVDAARQ